MKEYYDVFYVWPNFSEDVFTVLAWDEQGAIDIVTVNTNWDIVKIPQDIICIRHG